VPGAREVPPAGLSSAAAEGAGVMILVMEDPLFVEMVGMLVGMYAYCRIQEIFEGRQFVTRRRLDKRIGKRVSVSTRKYNRVWCFISPVCIVIPTEVGDSRTRPWDFGTMAKPYKFDLEL
jgi:hypothetical protein